MFNERAKYADALAGSYRRSSTPGINGSSIEYTTPVESDLERRGSGGSLRNTNMTRIRTRSVGDPFGAGVVFERARSDSQPSDDEIIIVTVRLNKKVRRDSFDEDLPQRPPRRGFFRRVSTRLMTPPDEDKYKAVKLPRGEYKRYFARDKEGNYAGTEPEREWEESDIVERYGRYQEIPLRSILC